MEATAYIIGALAVILFGLLTVWEVRSINKLGRFPSRPEKIDVEFTRQAEVRFDFKENTHEAWLRDKNAFVEGDLSLEEFCECWRGASVTFPQDDRKLVIHEGDTVRDTQGNMVGKVIKAETLNDERVFYKFIVDKAVDGLLPHVPYAPDGQALFPSDKGPNWKGAFVDVRNTLKPSQWVQHKITKELWEIVGTRENSDHCRMYGVVTLSKGPHTLDVYESTFVDVYEQAGPLKEPEFTPGQWVRFRGPGRNLAKIVAYQSTNKNPELSAWEYRKDWYSLEYKAGMRCAPADDLEAAAPLEGEWWELTNPVEHTCSIFGGKPPWVVPDRRNNWGSEWHNRVGCCLVPSNYGKGSDDD